MRCCCILLILCVLSGLIPASVVLAEEPYTYEILDGKAVITLYNGTEETVTVPDTLGDAPVAGIGAFAFEEAAVKELVLPDNLERIEDGAFFGCAALEKVTFGNSLTHLGDGAFADCLSLGEVLLPASLQTLGSQVFSGCNGIALLAVAEGCEAFSSLGNCILNSEGVLVAGCGTSVIPDDGSVVSIAPYAFSCMESLNAVAIPASVTEIGDGAFEGTGLTTFFLPASVSKVGKYILHDTALTALYCGGEAKPEGWHAKWNGGVEIPPIWSYDNTCGHAETREESLDPACAADGYKKTVCNLCESTLTLEILPAFGHTERTQTIPSTCAKAGYTRVLCTVCGKELSRKSLPVSTVHGSLRTESSAPTCEGTGYEKKICTVCGKTMSSVSRPALGHRVKTETVNPTCKEAGYTREYCTTCGKEFSRTLLSATAEHGALRTESAPPTCTEEGFTNQVCTVCGKVVSSLSSPAVGHTERTETAEPTCAEAGYKRVVCTVCGEVLSYEERPKTEDHPDLETRRGEPTCKEDGYLREICTLCGTAVTDTVLPALGHTYVTETVSPTCRKDGYTAVACGVCGEEKEYTLLPAPGHAYGEDGLCAYCGAPAPAPSSDFKVMICSGGLEILAYTGNSTHVVIPAYISGGAVVRIADGAFEGTLIESVTFPHTLQEIGKFAFENCTALTEIIVPGNVKVIQEGAFLNCSSVTRVYLAEGVETILHGAFGECTGLSSVVLPASLLELSPGVFNGCKSLRSLQVREGNPVYYSAGNCILEADTGTLLMGCAASVIPDDGSVKAIASGAFRGVAELKSLPLPEGILVIGAYAFSETGIEVLSLPASAVQVGRYILFDTPARQVFCYSEALPQGWHYNWIAGCEAEVLWNGLPCLHEETVLLSETAPGCFVPGSRIYGCGVCGTVTERTELPAATHVYRDGVCSLCNHPEGLLVELWEGTYRVVGYQGTGETLILPAVLDGIAVTAIQEGAFAGNTLLKTVFLPSSVITVGEGIFAGCGGLQEVRCQRNAAPRTWHESWAWGMQADLLWSAEPPVPQKPAVLYGDINGDGKIGAVDYSMLKRHVMKTLKLSEKQLSGADVNGDGRVNSVDYSMVKRHVMKTYEIPQDR